MYIITGSVKAQNQNPKFFLTKQAVEDIREEIPHLSEKTAKSVQNL
jgi:hypothetical protein